MNGFVNRLRDDEPESKLELVGWLAKCWSATVGSHRPFLDGLEAQRSLCLGRFRKSFYTADRRLFHFRSQRQVTRAITIMTMTLGPGKAARI